MEELMETGEITETIDQDTVIDEKEIRWRQRFRNFSRAFGRLTDAIRMIKENPDNVLMQAGLIQTYEFTFEVAWKTLKYYLEMEGFRIKSPRHAIRQAYQCGYIKEDVKVWLKALNDRNLMSHSYDESVAVGVFTEIQSTYYFLLKELYQWLSTR